MTSRSVASSSTKFGCHAPVRYGWSSSGGSVGETRPTTSTFIAAERTRAEWRASFGLRRALLVDRVDRCGLVPADFELFLVRLQHGLDTRHVGLLGDRGVAGGGLVLQLERAVGHTPGHQPTHHFLPP